MSTEQEKAMVELAVFGEFISKAGISIDAKSIVKPGTQSDPDIFCMLSSGEELAYELVEICSPDIAAIVSNGSDVVTSTSDPTKRTIRKKLHKDYKTNRPIELLCYTNGRTISPDDQIITEVRLWANAVNGPFRKIWLLGQHGVYEIWSVNKLTNQEGVGNPQIS